MLILLEIHLKLHNDSAMLSKHHSESSHGVQSSTVLEMVGVGVCITMTRLHSRL